MPASPDGEHRDGARPGVTRRAVLLGLLLLPANVYWIVYMELVRGGIWPTVMTLLFTAVAILFALLLANGVVARRRPKLALSRGELLTIYTMLSVGSALAGTDVLQTLISLMGRATYYASPENGWDTRILPLLPKWLTVTDYAAVKGYYEGNSTLYRWSVLAAWVPALAPWLGFILCMLLAMFSTNVLFRRQWVDAERLSYPIVSLPIELTRTDPPFLRQRLLWAGFALAAGLDVLNGIHYLLPAAPGLNCKTVAAMADFLRGRPWNGVGWMPITLYPFAIGLGFLIPLDLVFSCWFFYLVWKLERVAVYAFGLDTRCMRSSFDGPYSTEQVAGVWMVILAFSLWTGRHHLRAVWKEIRSPGSLPEPEREAMSYRRAAALALAGAVGMTLFLIASGMAPAAALFFVGAYLGLSLFLARVRAELGPPVHDMYGSGPDMILATTVGPASLDPGTRASLTMVHWINRESYRSHPMPAHAEALKAAGAAGIDARRLWWVLLLAALVGAVSAMWASLHYGYVFGAVSRFYGPAPSFADGALRRLDTWTQSPPPVLPMQRWAMAGGAALSLALLLARGQWLWFPLHPVGYAVSGWWAINLFWVPLLIATVLKGLILRYGGLRGYRAALPFFLGLILGEFVAGAAWQIIGVLWDINTYAFWV